MRKTTIAVALCGMALLAGGAARAAEDKQAEAKKAEEAWAKAMTPGPEHAHLAKGAGTWKLKVTSFMDPSAPPMVSESTSERRMIMGGRYLEDVTTGDMMGMKFEGRGITGFDNVDRKYHGSWIDNFGTGVMPMTGTCDAAKRTCTFTGDMNDPLTGKLTTMRMVETMVDDDHSITQFYGKGPDGKEFMSMKIEGTRVK